MGSVDVAGLVTARKATLAIVTADGYRERLRCPRSWYVTGALGGLVLAPEISFVTPLPVWSTALIGLLASAIIVTWVGHDWLVVEDGVLRVRRARLPARYIDAVIALDCGANTHFAGRHGDPAAFLAIKPWVSSGVQIVLDDPEDPVPYWAVSTRHPRELAAALGRARTVEETARGQ